ncbi:trypsin-like peptidase domain-containing protein [Pontixanthobacter sp.]|uniref:trypsin-like peptidase domain-containing protein n=1 Tax=Pontixanthobacter sp. TaxID=2792078 RepID=UPI003C7A3FEB
MNRIAPAIAALIAILPIIFTSAPARADPADIDASARSVVRVVIIDTDGTADILLSHGSGFAVSPTRIVTNAHVVRDVLRDSTLKIGVVPSEGDNGSFATLIDYSPKNDLALIEITEDLRLPALVIAGRIEDENSAVVALGYPGNVDMAQGLQMRDYFNSQPPVKSRGFLSGVRPSRQFDTVLHTAPIAGGNSGGPLLDACGKVIGVNSFGAIGGASDAEFFFAISTRELLPFLRRNNVSPRVNSLPCRSLADIEEAEQRRAETEQNEARSLLAAKAEADREQRARIRQEAGLAVQTERENAMAIAAILLLIGAAAAFTAYHAKQAENGEKTMMISGTIAATALVAALALWFTRPGLDAIDRRVNAAISGGNDDADDDPDAVGGGTANVGSGALICTLETGRSRITGTPENKIAFGWTDAGCVNGRTQYGFASGTWSRAFVPNQEDAVSVNRFDPASRTYTVDRYLLRRSAMDNARAQRGTYSPPGCSVDNAAAKLGDMQGAVLQLLPDRPNERLVYSCAEKAE